MTHPLNIALKHLILNSSSLDTPYILYLFIIDTKTEKIDFIHRENDWERFYLRGDIEFYCKNEWEVFYRNNTKRQLYGNKCDTEAEYIKLYLEFLKWKHPFCKYVNTIEKPIFLSEKIAFPFALELTKCNPFFEEFYNLSETVTEIIIEKKEDFNVQLKQLKEVIPF